MCETCTEHRLEHIRQLEANWDSYGAGPIDERALKAADQIIRALKHEPRIMPTSFGGILLTWGAGLFGDVDIWIEADGTLERD
jgi:hypothetical protein